jgi:YVTN family beta-propeller protein
MSRRRLIAIAAIAALLIAAAAAIPAILLTRGDDNPAKPTTAITRDTLQRIDPDTNKLIATIPYGQAGVEPYVAGTVQAGGFSVGEGAIWVFGPRIQTVLRIDPRTNTVAGQSAVSLEPEQNAGWVTYSLDAALGHVWVVTGTPTLTEIDPQTGVTTRQIPIPDDEASCSHVDASISPIWVWCTDNGRPGSIWSVDPQTERALRIVSYEQGFPSWITRDPLEPRGQRALLDWSRPTGTGLGLFDTTTTALVAEFDLPFFLGGFDTQDLGLPGIDEREVGPLWVSNPAMDQVWELDPFTNEVVAKIKVGRQPTGIELSESDNAVWVANSGDGTVSRIDPASGKVVATIEVGGSPQSIAVGERGVWVNVFPA